MKIFEKLKSDKKLLLIVIALVIGVFTVPYLTIPALFLWWFYKKSKFSKKTKIVASSVVGGLFTILVAWVAIAYSRDIEPHLVLNEPKGNITVQAHEIALKGVYDPVDRKVWINGKQISTENGSFETIYQLKMGENKIEVSAGNWKRARVNIVVTRELTEDEKAQIEAEERAKEEKEIAEKAAKEAESQVPTKTEEKSVSTTTPTAKPTTPPTAKPTVAPTPSQTVSQKNAVKKAKSYLNYTAFSHDGLVAQLEYEQFSHADAVYGADNSGANWNEQSAKKAKQYMEYSAFSRGSLIEQLRYDKFTQEQAEYGANAIGL